MNTNGVGAIPKSRTSTPCSIIAADTVLRIKSLEGLVSLATRHLISVLVELLMRNDANNLEKLIMVLKFKSCPKIPRIPEIEIFTFKNLNFQLFNLASQ